MGSEAERHGLFVLYPLKENASWDVDIVVLHGLRRSFYHMDSRQQANVAARFHPRDHSFSQNYDLWL